MLDWLKRPPREEPAIELAGQRLPIAIRRLAHARRMTLRLAPDGSEVRVSIPQWGRTAEALAFARSRADWLARQLAALPAPAPVGPGERLPYRGQWLTVAHSADAPHHGRFPCPSRWPDRHRFPANCSQSIRLLC